MEEKFTPVGKIFKIKAKNGKMVEYKIFDQDVYGIYYHKIKDETTGYSMTNRAFLNIMETGKAEFVL